MPQVQTMRGPIDVDDLGPTLMHEHVFVLNTEVVQNFGEGVWWDEDAQVAAAIDKLTALHAKGIATIVDPTVIGLGRYIPRLARIADQVPVNIVVATGVYTYGDLPFAYSQRGRGRCWAATTRWWRISSGTSPGASRPRAWWPRSSSARWNTPR